MHVFYIKDEHRIMDAEPKMVSFDILWSEGPSCELYLWDTCVYFQQPWVVFHIFHLPPTFTWLETPSVRLSICDIPEVMSWNHLQDIGPFLVLYIFLQLF